MMPTLIVQAPVIREEDLPPHLARPQQHRYD